MKMKKYKAIHTLWLQLNKNVTVIFKKAKAIVASVSELGPFCTEHLRLF